MEDFDGNLPNGFSANWRTFQHVQDELRLN
jgi:hypothetical protein